MLLKIVLAGALVAVATPALAQDRATSPLQVSKALKAGCDVQQTHLPAGKTGIAPTLLRCPSTVASIDDSKLAVRDTDKAVRAD